MNADNVCVRGALYGRLFWQPVAGCALGLVLTLLQLCCGTRSCSVALVAEALRNFSITVNAVIRWTAKRLNRNCECPEFCLSVRRAQLLGNLCFGAVLLPLALYILRESLEQWRDGNTIHGGQIVVLALLTAVVTLLQRHWLKRSDSAYRAAWRELWPSLLLLVNGIFAWCWQISCLDPLVALLLAANLFWHGIVTLTAAARVLLRAPRMLDEQILRAALQSRREVIEVVSLQIQRREGHPYQLLARVRLAAQPEVEQSQQRLQYWLTQRTKTSDVHLECFC